MPRDHFGPIGATENLAVNYSMYSYIPHKRIIRTLRCGDYGLRTTAGSHFQDWDETRVFSHPTVASSRRCVVEGFYVVWKGGLRIHHKGMKKQFNARKLRNSCCLTLELQTNARLEQLQELVNSVQRKMHR